MFIAFTDSMDSLESFATSTCPVTSFAGWDKVVPYQDFISISGRNEQSIPTSINTLQHTGKATQVLMLRQTLLERILTIIR